VWLFQNDGRFALKTLALPQRRLWRRPCAGSRRGPAHGRAETAARPAAWPRGRTTWTC